jgi:hypothetical protein
MNIDDTLGALAGSAVPAGLDTIAGDVFARIDADARASRQARRGLLIAIGAATIAGTAGAAIPIERPAEPSITMVATALAPSTLLGGVE